MIIGEHTFKQLWNLSLKNIRLEQNLNPWLEVSNTTQDSTNWEPWTFNIGSCTPSGNFFTNMNYMQSTPESTPMIPGRILPTESPEHLILEAPLQVGISLKTWTTCSPHQHSHDNSLVTPYLSSIWKLSPSNSFGNHL